ncbi:hypothetical protein L484_019563 [Morus notabilis]|uniref:Uncharacterized protein n=1 Tax=Morus notabilis TaxID=981085 RepID=W9S6H4_9ROSA|nr:hypothetical protein L484_019563 [Morus notabilis]
MRTWHSCRLSEPEGAQAIARLEDCRYKSCSVLISNGILKRFREIHGIQIETYIGSVETVYGLWWCVKLQMNCGWEIKENQRLQTVLHLIMDRESGRRRNISSSKSSETTEMNLDACSDICGGFPLILLFLTNFLATSSFAGNNTLTALSLHLHHDRKYYDR